MKDQDDGSARSKDQIKDIKSSLSELKSLLEVASYLGIKSESERGKKAIKSATEFVKNGDLEKTQTFLTQSCDFLKEKIDEKVDHELDRLRSFEDTVSNEKKNKNIKIDRVLKKLEKTKKDGDYEDIPELVFNAWDEVKKREKKQR